MKNSESLTVQPIPKGYHAVTPWIISPDSAKLIDFLKKAFSAKETENSRVYNEDGTIGHVEIKINDSVIMLFDSKKNWNPTPSFMRLYVEDADAVFQRAIEAGAKP